MKGWFREFLHFFGPSELGEVMDSSAVAGPANIIAWPLWVVVIVLMHIVAAVTIVLGFAVLMVVVPLAGPMILVAQHRQIAQLRRRLRERGPA